MPLQLENADAPIPVTPSPKISVLIFWHEAGKTFEHLKFILPFKTDNLVISLSL